ncbi:MAG: CoA ester lyase [SAR324 cluster bacterium]|nr:CoA ester lyase [SAR324 cluster bacterium]
MSEVHFSEHELRPERCLLSLPATTERFFPKAAASQADTIMLDLEDAVAPDLKEDGRKQAIAALNEMDWGRKTMCVRINGLDTQWGYRDLIDLAESCPRLDTVMVPKLERPQEVHAVAIFLSGAEMAKGRQTPIGIEVLIETALGMVNVDAIAASHPRLESISFGPGDYSASMGNRSQLIGGPDPDYTVLTYPDAQGRRERHWNDVWHSPLSRIATACRAYNIRALDGPYPDFNDTEGFLSSAKRAVSLGFVGKWAIHPSQVPLANEVFGPSQEEINFAQRMMEALEQGKAEGKGAVILDGNMIDLAHARQARRILAQAERISARKGD